MADVKLSGDFKFFDLNGNALQLTLAVPPPPPPVVVVPTVPVAPGPVTNVAATDSLATIQSKLDAVPAGGSLAFLANMTIPGPLRGKSGVTLWAAFPVSVGGPFNFDGLSGWAVRGSEPGKGFVFGGTNRLSAQGASNFAIGNNVFNNIASNGFNGSAIALNGGSVNGLIINNDFNSCDGNVVGMYDLDHMNFDGNHFNECRQPFSIQESTTPNPAKGNALIWRRNIFIGTKRAAIEVGPASTGSEYFGGLIVENNFFDDFDCQGDAGTMLPISLVGQAAQNTKVLNNFIRKGYRKTVSGLVYTVGIEFTGSGECAGNVIDGFYYHLLYKSGWNVHNNATFGSPNGFTVNQAGATGTNVNHVFLTSPPLAPAKPARVVW